ncbi:hypothetical protein THAOC_04483, partial [Thalassiosira oceanica]
SRRPTAASSSIDQFQVMRMVIALCCLSNFSGAVRRAAAASVRGLQSPLLSWGALPTRNKRTAVPNHAVPVQACPRVLDSQGAGTAPTKKATLRQTHSTGSLPNSGGQP